MRQRERLLLTITHDIKAPAASISGFIDLMKEYVSDPKGTSCLSNIKTQPVIFPNWWLPFSIIISWKRAHATEPCQFLARTVGETKCGRAQNTGGKKGLAISCEFQNADKDNIWGKYSEVMTSASDRCWTIW